MRGKYDVEEGGMKSEGERQEGEERDSPPAGGEGLAREQGSQTRGAGVARACQLVGIGQRAKNLAGGAGDTPQIQMCPVPSCPPLKK